MNASILTTLGGFPTRVVAIFQAQSGWSTDFASGHAAVARWLRPGAFSVSFECIACPSTMVCKTVGCHENLRDVRVDHETQPRVNLRQMRLLPAKRGAQGQECCQQRHRQVYGPLASKQPQEVIDKDEVPIHLREKCVEDPEQKGCQASPVGLGTGHAICAYLVHPPFLGHLEPPVLPEDLHSPVGLGDVRLEQHPPGARLRP